MIDLRFLLAPGNHAARPAANTVGKGALYFCTEHAKIYRSDLSTWTDALTGVTGTPGTVTSVSGTAPISVATGTTTPAITHDTSGVGAGTSSGITVDTKGHVTARTALVAADLPAAPYTYQTADYTLLVTDERAVLDTTTAVAHIILTLPSLASVPLGKMYTLINLDLVGSYRILLAPDGADMVNNANAQWSGNLSCNVMLMATTAGWWAAEYAPNHA